MQLQLDPVLLSMMPQHKVKQPGDDKTEKEFKQHENVERLKKVKKVIQKQRWMKIKNSNFTNPIDNMNRIRREAAGPKMRTQANLLRSYNYNSSLNP